MDGLSGSQATTLALQLNSLFLHHSMNTYRLCFKASDILNGSVSLQFIIGLADSLADQVTKFPLPLLTITKLHPPPKLTLIKFQHPLTITELQPTVMESEI